MILISFAFLMTMNNIYLLCKSNDIYLAIMQTRHHIRDYIMSP